MNFQLKLDAAELLRLVELTERRRVKDILTIEAKKIETEISLLREKESEVVSKKTSHDSSAGKRTYTVKLNTYGESLKLTFGEEKDRNRTMHS